MEGWREPQHTVLTPAVLISHCRSVRIRPCRVRPSQGSQAAVSLASGQSQTACRAEGGWTCCRRTDVEGASACAGDRKVGEGDGAKPRPTGGRAPPGMLGAGAVRCLQPRSVTVIAPCPPLSVSVKAWRSRPRLRGPGPEQQEGGVSSAERRRGRSVRREWFRFGHGRAAMCELATHVETLDRADVLASGAGESGLGCRGTWGPQSPEYICKKWGVCSDTLKLQAPPKLSPSDAAHLPRRLSAAPNSVRHVGVGAF